MPDNPKTDDNVDKLKTDDNADKVPEGVTQAVLRLVWGKPWTPYAIAACVIAIALFAVWSSLPDDTKHAWLSRKPPESKPDGTSSTQAKLNELNGQLAEIDTELKRLDGTEELLQAVRDLKTKYPKGFDIPLSGDQFQQGENLMLESVAFLQRMKAYDLSPNEQTLAESAENWSKGIFASPPDVYKEVLKLAESLNTKADKLEREREAILAQKARVLNAT